MNKIALIPFVFYQIPEAVLLIAAALGLLGLRIRLGRLVIAGLSLGVLTEISRHFLFDTGLHTPVILLGLILALTVGFRVSINTAVTGCFLSFFLLRMGDALLVTPAFKIAGVSFQSVLSNPWLHVAFGWISGGFLVIATGLCCLGGFILIRAPESRPDSLKG